MKKGLIIPEMEDIKIENEEKVQESEPDTPPQQESNIEESKKSNTEEFMEFLAESVDLMYKFSRQITSLFYSDKKTDFWSRLLGKYTILMPQGLSHDNKILRNLLGGEEYLSILKATKVITKYLEWLENKYYKNIKDKRPFFNDQHFSTYENITINENDKLELLDNIIDTCSSMVETFEAYQLLNDRTTEDIKELFTAYINGIKEIKRHGMLRIKQGKSFSDLTKRLIKVNKWDF